MIEENYSDWSIGYSIARLTEGQPHIASQLNELEHLTEEQYDKIITAKSNINDYAQSSNLIDAVHQNLNEFIESFFFTAKNFLETKSLNEDEMDFMAFDFSRLLLNVLAMFRSFLDHTDAAISRKFGKDSTEFLSWKAKQSEIFDKSFAYRFFYKLRNYTQHVGMPPMHIALKATSENEGIEFNLTFLRDELLKEDLWSKQIKEDLIQQPEKFLVFNIVNDWSEAFIELSTYLLEFKKKLAYQSAAEILKYREIYTNIPEEAKLYLMKIKSSERGVLIALGSFPETKAKKLIAGEPILEL